MTDIPVKRRDCVHICTQKMRISCVCVMWDLIMISKTHWTSIHATCDVVALLGVMSMSYKPLILSNPNPLLSHLGNLLVSLGMYVMWTMVNLMSHWCVIISDIIGSLSRVVSRDYTSYLKKCSPAILLEIILAYWLGFNYIL